MPPLCLSSWILPGGLLNSTKDIVKILLNSEVPVIVYVYPRGATATSAGVFITLSAHVAAHVSRNKHRGGPSRDAGGVASRGARPPGSRKKRKTISLLT